MKRGLDVWTVFLRRACDRVTLRRSARGPLSLLGVSYFASCKMFAECTFSRRVVVSIIRGKRVSRRVKMFARRCVDES